MRPDHHCKTPSTYTVISGASFLALKLYKCKANGPISITVHVKETVGL